MTRRRASSHASVERFEARVRRHTDERFLARKMAARARRREESAPVEPWASRVLDVLAARRIVTLSELDELTPAELNELAALAVVVARTTVETGR